MTDVYVNTKPVLIELFLYAFVRCASWKNIIIYIFNKAEYSSGFYL